MRKLICFTAEETTDFTTNTNFVLPQHKSAGILNKVNHYRKTQRNIDSGAQTQRTDCVEPI
jgi:hypothetical protein